MSTPEDTSPRLGFWDFLPVYFCSFVFGCFVTVLAYAAPSKFDRYVERIVAERVAAEVAKLNAEAGK